MNHSRLVGRSTLWGLAFCLSMLACSGSDGPEGPGAGGAGVSGGASAGGSSPLAGAGSVSGGSSSLGGTGGSAAASGAAGSSAGASAGGSTSGAAGSSAGGAGGSNGGSMGQAGSTGGQLPMAGTSAGGSAGSSGYQPCPTDGKACIILPFGDSITDGVGSTDLAGYRSPLFALAVQANQKITFVGSRSSGPNQVSNVTFPKNHEGHPGWTIDSGYVSFGEGISTLVPMPAFKTIPDIVLLMIGTNDVSADKGTDKVAERLETLLDKIVQAAPDALIVVAQPTPIGWNPAALATYSSKIPGIVQARAAKGQHMLSVDMSKMPATGLGSDSIHPNDQGYAYMAQVWYAATKDFLPH